MHVICIYDIITSEICTSYHIRILFVESFDSAVVAAGQFGDQNDFIRFHPGWLCDMWWTFYIVQLFFRRAYCMYIERGCHIFILFHFLSRHGTIFIFSYECSLDDIFTPLIVLIYFMKQKTIVESKWNGMIEWKIQSKLSLQISLSSSSSSVA